MSKSTGTSIMSWAALFLLLACAEPTAPPPAAEVLPSLDRVMAEVTTDTEKSGKHVFKYGKDEYVIDEASSTLRRNEKKLLMPKEHIRQLAATFDRMAAFDVFFEALYKNPKFLECLDAGKKANLGSKLSLTPITQSLAEGTKRSGFLTANLSVATPVSGPQMSEAINPIDVSGGALNCTSLTLSYSNILDARNAMKLDIAELLGGMIAAGIGGSLFPNPEILDPVVGGEAALAFLLAELAVAYAEVQHMEIQLKFLEVLLASYNCIPTLPPVVVGSTGGGGPNSGDCHWYIGTYWASTDGGESYQAVYSWIFSTGACTA